MNGENQRMFTPDGYHQFFINDSIMMGLKDYIEGGIPTGDFLKAVLENDLKEAFGRADLGNILNMFAIVSWLYNFAPSPCWGSPEKVADWLRIHKEARAKGL